MRARIVCLHVCALLFTGLYGCASMPKQADPCNTFLVDVRRPGGVERPVVPVVLMVQPFSAAPGIEPRQLLYRRSASRYESDYYNRFITDVGALLAEQTRRWLARSGRFAHVLPVGSRVEATHLLEGHLTQLHTDFRDRTNAQAVMEVAFYLVDMGLRKPVVAFHGTYSATVGISAAQPEAIVAAYNQCLEQILTELERGLREQQGVVGGAIR